jgi:hypothetical protein
VRATGVPTHNVDAEEDVLGAILLAGTALQLKLRPLGGGAS